MSKLCPRCGKTNSQDLYNGFWHCRECCKIFSKRESEAASTVEKLKNKMTTDELNKQYDNLLRKEGYIEGMFAVANMIEKHLPMLQRLNGKQCCTVLSESIREQANERKKECEKERSEIQNVATQELISEWKDKEE